LLTDGCHQSLQHEHLQLARARSGALSAGYALYLQKLTTESLTTSLTRTSPTQQGQAGDEPWREHHQLHVYCPASSPSGQCCLRIPWLCDQRSCWTLSHGAYKQTPDSHLCCPQTKVKIANYHKYAMMQDSTP
jgi:hypothetical protein